MTVWGLDPSTLRLAIAWQEDPLPDESRVRGAASIDFDKSLKGIARLVDIYARVLHGVRELPGPSLVVIEQPFAHNVHPASYMVIGVQALAIRHATGADVQFVGAPTWKKVALDNGAATKQDIAAWCVSWALPFANQDEADANGICDYAADLAGRRDE